MSSALAAPATAPGAAFAVIDRDGRSHYLHRTVKTLATGQHHEAVYFSQHLTPGRAIPALPPGYTVVVNPRTGRPYARKA